MNSDLVYLHLQRIEKTASRLEKDGLLPLIPREILEYTYHPHWTYGFTKTGPIKLMKGKGNRQIDKTGFDLLELLKTKRTLPASLMGLVGKYIASLTPFSASLYKRILLKDLRCGVAVKSIIKLYPGLVPDEFVMKGEDYDIGRVRYPVWGSPKVDGLRGLYRNGQIYTSSGRLHVGLDHIIAELRMRNVTQAVDGEIAIPNLSFDISSGMIRSRKSTPQARFYVFDLPDMPAGFEDRHYNCVELLRNCMFIYTLEHVRLPDDSAVQRYFDVVTWNKLVAGVPVDGIMLKTPNHRYQYTKSWDWMKMKLHDTADVRVVGTEAGTGKYDGMIGALVCKYKGETINVGIGLSDKDRQRTDWIGKIIEVGFMEKSSHGKLRHPKLLRERWDKE